MGSLARLKRDFQAAVTFIWDDFRNLSGIALNSKHLECCSLAGEGTHCKMSQMLHCFTRCANSAAEPGCLSIFSRTGTSPGRKKASRFNRTDARPERFFFALHAREHVADSELRGRDGGSLRRTLD